MELKDPDLEASPPSPGPPEGIPPLDISKQQLNAYQALDPEQYQRLTRHQHRRKLAIATVAVVLTLLVILTISLCQRPPLAPDAFRYQSYDQIVDRLLRLHDTYPEFVEVFSAQERYGLPLRNELQCKRNGQWVPCQHYVIKITNQTSLPDPSRPEVFFSGGLHGDERVGPQAAMALAELLVTHAANASGMPWLKRLVDTRTIVIMPTTNAYGYEHDTREEGDYDPNRDFPYANGGKYCFRTMVARAVNEVWRHHLFQLAVTWHAGIRSISYEWGSYNHFLFGRPDGLGSDVSPDDRAQFFVAMGMSRFGGTFQEGHTYYETGRMNDIVYAVNGGMEDWAYAASWENDTVFQCEPITYGGYDKAKSVYNNATHRSFNILIETSDDKQPYEDELGTPAALSAEALGDFLPTNESIGHVPRNVRLALCYIDLLQPYIEWKHHLNATITTDTVDFTWEVAGAITVDKTQLLFSTNADLSNATVTTTQSGVTRWYHPDMGEVTTATRDNKGIFSQQIQFPRTGVFYVQAQATVDQNWAEQPETPKPNVKPQTHIVNDRTNDKWFYKANNRTVQGKTVWTSSVLQVVVE